MIIIDLRFLGFFAGIPYGHILGHRGITHSIAFAVTWSALASWLYCRWSLKGFRWQVLVYLLFCTSSHGLIDACTSGGHGIALLSPFNNERIFFPFRPIMVSPLGVDRFFGEWGLRVLASEAKWLGLPALAVGIGASLWHRLAR